MEDKVFEDPVFTSDDIDNTGYDSPTMNILDTGSIHYYWSRNPDVITVNIIKIDKDDPTKCFGQFYSSDEKLKFSDNKPDLLLNELRK